MNGIPYKLRRGFTLIELLIAMVLLTMLLSITAFIVSSTVEVIDGSTRSSEKFKDAREAFETISRRMSQATLNTYWDYRYNRSGEPTGFLRQSELHFVCGPAAQLLSGSKHTGNAIFFTAPFGYAGNDSGLGTTATDPYQGLESLLNAWGYYLEWSGDDLVPEFIKDSPGYKEKKRWRLMEFREPSEKLAIYSEEIPSDEQVSRSDAYEWFSDGVGKESRVVADNILALVTRCKVPLTDAQADNKAQTWIAPDYLFDSRKHLWASADQVTEATRNQLPPLVEVLLVAVDEGSMARHQKLHGTEQTDFGVGGLFQDSGEFQEDIATLEENLRNAKIDYVIFSATVPIRGAKWSE